MNNKILNILREEGKRQREEHNFIASENFASEDVRYFCGSVFTNKYAEGFPGKRYYNGCGNYDAPIFRVISRTKRPSQRSPKTLPVRKASFRFSDAIIIAKSASKAISHKIQEFEN